MYALRNTNADTEFRLFTDNADYKGTIRVNEVLADEFETRLIPFAPFSELATIVKIFWDAQTSRNCAALDEDAVSEASRICAYIIYWLSQMIVLKHHFAEKNRTGEN